MITIGLNVNDNVDIDSAMNSYFSSGTARFQYKILKGLTFNKGWQAIIVLDDDIYLEAKLIEHLSQSLSTKVLGFEEIDTVTAYKVFLYEKGVLQDELDTVDFELYEAGGYFSDLGGSSEGFKPTVLDKYFKEVGFEPGATEILSNID